MLAVPTVWRPSAASRPKVGDGAGKTGAGRGGAGLGGAGLCGAGRGGPLQGKVRAATSELHLQG